MNNISRTILLIALALFSTVSLRASPDYPFEGLLPRAKVVFTGQVVAHDNLHVTFAVLESLRGQTETRLTFSYSSPTDRTLPSASDEFLVLSQGDDYWGKPVAVVSLGQKVKGQISYLGWIAFPIKTIQGTLSVDLVRTVVDHKGSILSLERAKTLIKELPYGGKRGGVEQIVEPERRKRLSHHS